MKTTDVSFVGTFAAGFAAGALVAWYVSKMVERARRALFDFHRARRGLRTLIVMVFSRSWSAVKAAAVGVVVLAAVVAMYWAGQR